VVNFANWRSTPEDVLRFTKKHGPITLPFHEWEEDDEFGFQLQDWVDAQKEFRNLWRPIKRMNASFDPEDGDSFQYVNGRLTYLAASWLRVLRLAVMTTEGKRLKKCANPECPTPFFIANHLSTRYCTMDCANWAQKRVKREWWNSNRAGMKRTQAG
jgi:hypothetical protein